MTRAGKFYGFDHVDRAGKDYGFDHVDIEPESFPAPILHKSCSTRPFRHYKSKFHTEKMAQQQDTTTDMISLKTGDYSNYPAVRVTPSGVEFYKVFPDNGEEMKVQTLTFDEWDAFCQKGPLISKWLKQRHIDVQLFFEEKAHKLAMKTFASKTTNEMWMMFGPAYVVPGAIRIRAGPMTLSAESWKLLKEQVKSIFAKIAEFKRQKEKKEEECDCSEKVTDSEEEQAFWFDEMDYMVSPYVPDFGQA